MTFEYKKDGKYHCFKMELQIRVQDDNEAVKLKREMEIFYGKKMSLAQKGQYF